MKSERSLDGIKVLDFTRVYSGPYCTMLLGDLGAEIIKVEALGKGDDTRLFAPIVEGESGYFMYLNRNKKSLCLDLKTEKGKEIALKLMEWADVVIENFSPGTMERLGLDYEAAKNRNPKIIYASISGFGQDGPYRDKVAYDAVAQAMGGMTYLTGNADADPVRVGPAISDAATGVHTAVAILSAMLYRDKSGKGQYIDMAMMDTVFSMLENFVSIKTMTGVNPERSGNANPGSAPYNMYKTKTNYIVIATANNSLFQKLINVIGKPELIEDPRFRTNPDRKKNEAAIDAIIEEWTLQHTNQEIEEALNKARVPVACLKSVEELIEDPQVACREMLIEQDNPVLGKVKLPGSPLKLKETPPDTSMRAPILGEHTEEILREVLQYSDLEIATIREEKII